jgi:hypothetical protein
MNPGIPPPTQRTSSSLLIAVGTPMIFVTAFPEKGIGRGRLKPEPSISKPFDGKTMIKSLATALKGHGADVSE